MCTTVEGFLQADKENGAMQFLDGSHMEGFFEHVQSKREGNILNENQDIVIPDRYQDKIIQTELQPGECSIHDGTTIKKPRLADHLYVIG